MEENKYIFQLKELEKCIVIFLTKGKIECKNHISLTTTQIRIIDYIFKHDKDNIYQRDIEKSLNLTRATLSGVLKTMEKNNIIKREINNNDARSKKIILNSQFEELFVSSHKRLKEAENILVDDIDIQELATFKNVLSKMKNNIEKHNKLYERND